MKTLKIYELNVLASMAELCSFSRTAEKFGVTQAALSKMIAGIEGKVGGKLFERDMRPVQLTQFGSELMPYIQDCIRGNTNLIDFTRHWLEKTAGNLTIAAPSGLQLAISRYVMPDLFIRMPDTHITLKTQNQSLLDIKKGVNFPEDCDILITYAPPGNHNLVARKINRVRLNVYSTDAYYKSHPFDGLNELFQHNFLLQSAITDENKNATIELHNNITQELSSIQIAGKYVFDNIYVASECCKQGLGYMFLPQMMATPEDGIHPRLGDEYGIYIDIYMIFRYHENYPSRLRTSIDLIADKISSVDL